MSLDTKELTKHIKNPRIREMVDGLIKHHAGVKTFSKKTSSTGKYHPDVSNVPDRGIYNHTMLVVYAAQRLIYFYQQKGLLKGDMDSCIISACILHDMWKYETMNGTIAPYSTKDHGLVGYNSIRKWEVPKDLKAARDVIAEMVRFHMSAWCSPVSEKKLANENKDLGVLIVQLADMIASCKELINFGKEA